MLYPAISYADQLRERFRSIWFKDKYKYWNCDTYYDEWNPDENTWNHHQFASVRDGEVIGYIGYKINRSIDSVFGLNIINFEDSPSATFSLNLGRALRDILKHTTSVN